MASGGGEGDPEKDVKDIEKTLDHEAVSVAAANQPLDYISITSESVSDVERSSDEDLDLKIHSSRPDVHRSVTTSTRFSTVSTEPPESIKVPQKPWYKTPNPLKWTPEPPVPKERTVCPEYQASFWSSLTFSWMGPIMRTGYRRTLQPNDIWTVNPERSMDFLADKLTESFNKRRDRGDKNPLLWSLYDTTKNEFLMGGFCSLCSSLLQVMSPFTLRFLIQFAQEAYAGQGVSIGPGIGLVIGVTAMQVLQSIAVTHFIYRGFQVGGELRSVLITVIFEKAMRISGRARAGGKSDSRAAEDQRRAELQAEKKNLLERILHKKASKKEVVLPPGSGWSNGRVINLMSTDTYRIYEGCGLFHMIWSSPLAAIITLIVLLVNLTYSALAGFALLVIGLPLLTKAIKKLLIRRRAISKITDQRVSLTQEVLQSVRFVKFNNWTTSFVERIDTIRKKEVSAIQVVLSMRNAILAISLSLPTFASMLSFITYSLTGNALNPARVFSSLALFNSLRMPLNLLPMAIGQVTDAWASIGRIEEFLLAEEIEDDILWDETNEKAIVIEKADFTWERNISDAEKDQERKDQAKNAPPGAKKKGNRISTMFKKPVHDEKEKNESEGSLSLREELQPFALHDINLSIARNELIAVIGTVGSGKTSLLAALAGDMRKTSGSVMLGASRAFCPQYAWIQNATVKDNILFGKEMNRDWYNKVIEACALAPDMEILPAGDLTEIGERGITLSGGQKQRLNIARAIYHNSDIVLMDDPLSAVDAHVGRHIMDKAICGLLDGKARVLATHQLHVLNRCDRIVVLENGAIRVVDTFDNLMNNDEGFRKLMAETSQEEKTEEKEEIPGDGEERKEEKKDIQRRKKAKKAAALMTEEERAVKSVSWTVYGAYLKASGSYFNGPIAALLLILSQGANIVTSLWLAWWTSNNFGFSTGQYIGAYAALAVANGVLTFIYSVAVAVGGTNASKVMLRNSMWRVLRAPMSFFDTTPLGRIINRFSKDVDIMDNTLTDALRMFTFTMAMVVSVFILIIAYFHYFAIALVPLMFVFLFAAGYYRASAREIKRIESVKRSFVFARFGEGISGVASIRAYGLQKQFTRDLRDVLDDMNSAYYLTFSNQRWLSLRLDLIGNILVFVTGILVVTSRFNVSPSISGLVLSYILAIVQMMQFSVRQLSEVENAMNSTERLHYYGTALDEEAPLHAAEVPKSWPEHGRIVFDQVEMRYRSGLPLVLQGFNMDVRAGERIGIVGRTGAGKSSIMSTLFRLSELHSGTITIDGIDIAKVGLEDLRSRLAIIPQDPTLFKGTIRSNLDPFDKYTDLELWSALRQADLVSSDPESMDKDGVPNEKIDGVVSRINLDSLVDEEGLNYSLGQRQLMALARALVKNSQVIVADEATSSVDMETDAKIQQTIATAFKGRTLLVIAHRLRTIIKYDRICVMADGRIEQLDTPKALWEQGGTFRSMCERSGIRAEDIYAEDTKETVVD